MHMLASFAREFEVFRTMGLEHCADWFVILVLMGGAAILTTIVAFAMMFLARVEPD